jgi:hypothetical protein
MPAFETGSIEMNIMLVVISKFTLLALLFTLHMHIARSNVNWIPVPDSIVDLWRLAVDAHGANRLGDSRY